ncbi:MAG: hypothetical protein K0R41_2495 [Geminicoccaceae bacterium]|nr:hypothetical protein [Geminicoccaceae bacterium]MDF2765722.1 hypothetical protein [Rhodospirillales bacterium]
MICEDVQAALGPFHTCVETGDGARLTTQCLYPSFDPVAVFVTRVGEIYRVHDGGGAERTAWTHGRDEQLIGRMLARHAARYQIRVVDGALVTEAQTLEWLPSAVLAVANASASAATAIIERSRAAGESVLREQVHSVLSKAFDPSLVIREFPFVGRSGKEHRFDFAIRQPHEHVLLIDAVVPHHVSVSAKYVAFADTRLEHGHGLDRFAVYDRPLEPSDASLLQQVADLVPLRSLEPGVKRALAHHVLQ